jgi:hypothetical protein
MRRALGLLFCMLCIPLVVDAAIISIRGERVELSAEPEFPTPNATVSITAHTSLESLAHLFSWTVDGELRAEGVGLTALKVPVGELGTETVVEVALMEQGEIKGAAVYVLRPTEVDLVWEGKTYVPPLYQGLPLANGNADVVIAAYPHFMRNGREIPREQLSYTWEVDGVVVQDKSGYGRATLTMKPPRYSNSFRVGVVVQSRDGLLRGRGVSVITPVQPRAIVYEDRPLVGLNFNRAITSVFPLAGDEATFKTIPFFAARASTLEYEWRINGTLLPESAEEPGTATFRRTGATSGTYPIEVRLSDTRFLFERAAQSFEIGL